MTVSDQVLRDLVVRHDEKLISHDKSIGDLEKAFSGMHWTPMAKAAVMGPVLTGLIAGLFAVVLKL